MRTICREPLTSRKIAQGALYIPWENDFNEGQTIEDSLPQDDECARIRFA